MAWSDAARAAALEARRLHYNKSGAEIVRKGFITGRKHGKTHFSTYHPTRGQMVEALSSDQRIRVAKALKAARSGTKGWRQQLPKTTSHSAGMMSVLTSMLRKK